MNGGGEQMNRNAVVAQEVTDKVAVLTEELLLTQPPLVRQNSSEGLALCLVLLPASFAKVGLNIARN